MINIFTFSDKRPDFIKLQFDSMKKFIKDEFKLFVFDNSSTQNLSEQIRKECKENNITVLDTIKNHSNSNTACWVPINFCLKNYLKNDDISVIIDSDIFMINDFSFLNYIEDYDIAGVYQQRNNLDIEYLWNALVIINNKSINEKNIVIDFEPINPITDVGGKTSSLVNDTNVKIKWINHTADISCLESSQIFKDFEYKTDYGFQIIENSFLHYYRGSNWDGKSYLYHQEKTECLKKILNNDSFKIPLNFQEKFISNKSHSYKHWNGTYNLEVPNEFKKE